MTKISALSCVLIILLITALSGCESKNNKRVNIATPPNDQFETFDSTQHLQPFFDKKTFDSLHGFEFGWALLEPINIAQSRDDDKELSKRFSPGQKALYFIWYLDAQVRNGGFPQFYLNGYGEYIPAIKIGLQLIGDTGMHALVMRADNEYKTHQKVIDSFKQRDDWGPLYEPPYKFETYDRMYYLANENMMKLIEAYARQHPYDFVKFK